MRIQISAAVLALALAGCGSASAAHHSAHATTPAAHPASGPATITITCPTIAADLSTVLADQRSQNRTEQENWVQVSDGSLTGQGSDLQALASLIGSGDVQGPVGTLDAWTYVQDVNAFLTDQGSGLAPGWIHEYRHLQHAIAALAGDCGMGS